MDVPIKINRFFQHFHLLRFEPFKCNLQAQCAQPTKLMCFSERTEIIQENASGRENKALGLEIFYVDFCLVLDTPFFCDLST